VVRKVIYRLFTLIRSVNSPEFLIVGKKGETGENREEMGGKKPFDAQK
jgi:hypothetical protein